MKVLVTDGIAPEAVKLLEEAGHEVVLDEASPEELDHGHVHGEGGHHH